MSVMRTKDRSASKTPKPSYLSKHAGFCCRVFDKKQLSTRKRNQLIAKASDKQIFAICECIRNVVTCKCPLPSKHKQTLQKYKSTLLKLSGRKASLPVDQRRTLLQQKGSGIFLPLIGSAVASYLINKISGN